MCMGDFNEVMWNTEKRGGNICNRISMRLFRDTLVRCNLRDVGFTGPPFTWSNGRKGGDNVMERLDRVVANSVWLDLFLVRQVHHLPRYKSDHAPIILECSKENANLNEQKQPRKFRLEHMWLEHPEFGETMKRSWNDSYMGENLMEKLQRCGVGLTQWADRTFGSVRKKKGVVHQAC